MYLKKTQNTVRDSSQTTFPFSFSSLSQSYLINYHLSVPKLHPTPGFSPGFSPLYTLLSTRPVFLDGLFHLVQCVQNKILLSHLVLFLHFAFSVSDDDITILPSFAQAPNLSFPSTLISLYLLLLEHLISYCCSSFFISTYRHKLQPFLLLPNLVEQPSN